MTSKSFNSESILIWRMLDVISQIAITSEVILKIFQNAHVCSRANDSPIVYHRVESEIFRKIPEILQLFAFFAV